MKKIYVLTLGLLIGAGLMAQDLIVDFEDKAIGDPIHSISWGEAEAEVADDPLATGNNVLKFTPNNYNAAPVVSFTLPEGKTLADYSAFQFKGYFAAGDVGWKDIMVTVTQDLPSGPFFEPDKSEGVVIGDFNRAQGASTEWETIEIKITNELSDLTGTIYLAFGMNQDGKDGETVWYADDIELKSVYVSILGVDNSSVAVSSSSGAIAVNNCAGKQVAVYSLVGNSVYSGLAKSNEVTVNVPSGIYIVVVDGISQKVAVR